MFTVVKDRLQNGNILIREAKPEEVIPKDHHWLLVLDNMKKKGIADKFKFIYDGKVFEKPYMFAYDDVKGGIGVRRPDKVLLIKMEKEGYWEEEKVVGEVDFNYYADPDLGQSLKILDLVKEV